jgi:hypothetical protein
VVRLNSKSIQSDLDLTGWCWIPHALSLEPIRILAALGPVLPPRKDGGEYYDLRPYAKDGAPPASMSAKTGTDAQPGHTDAAYCPLPPRYVALQCLEPGEVPCPTHLWPLDMARLQRDRPKALTEPIWIVRGGGHSPFYCSVMEVQYGSTRVRFDPLCMRPASESSWTVETAQKALNSYAHRLDFDWERGALLIINNWRCLHARGAGAGGAPSRRLRRWCIGAANGLDA